jgi:hypothetical protein
MIITATPALQGILDLSSGERLQEDNPVEKIPFRLYLKPGQTVTVEDHFYTLRNIQNALKAGLIQITLQYTRMHVGPVPPTNPALLDIWVDTN